MKKRWQIPHRQYLVWLFQLAAFLILVLFLVFLTRRAEVHPILLEQAAETFLDMSNEKLQAENARVLRSRYGLNSNELEAFEYYGPVSNMNVEELLLVEMTSEEQGESVRKAMEERLAYQKTCFDGYGTDQMGLLTQARIVIRGKYGLFVVSSDAQEIAEEFRAMLAGGR